MMFGPKWKAKIEKIDDNWWFSIYIKHDFFGPWTKIEGPTKSSVSERWTTNNAQCRMNAHEAQHQKRWLKSIQPKHIVKWIKHK